MTLSRLNPQQQILILLAVLIVGLAIFSPKTPKVASINALEALQLIDTQQLLVLDVRDPAPYQKGHLPGALSVPIDQLQDWISGFDGDKTSRILVYCNDGSSRGPLATQQLQAAGYSSSVNLHGGIESWRAQQLPVQHGKPAAT